MKLAVDVKHAVQVLDLDTGKHTNYLVFEVGGQDVSIPATDEQLQEAIREANGQHVPESLPSISVNREQMPPPSSAYPGAATFEGNFAELGVRGELLEDLENTVMSTDAAPLGDLVGFILPDTPMTSTAQREQNIQETRAQHQPSYPKPEVLAARARANIEHRRHVQSDEAGNPVVEPARSFQPAPGPPLVAQYTLPVSSEQDEDGIPAG